MWYVYVLLCSNDSFYTGISNNPKKRFIEHKNGKGGKYTRSFKPLKIIHMEKYNTKEEALKRESQIKSWDRINKIKILKLKYWPEVWLLLSAGCVRILFTADLI